MSNPLAIEIKDLYFSYRRSSAVLTKINLQVKTGDFWAIIGPNGGGKSSLLKLILGLFKPDSGEIRIFSEKGSTAKSSLGYVPQNINDNRDFPITVAEVIATGLIGVPAATANISLVGPTAEKLGISNLLEQRIDQLSGGQRQRAYISRAIISQPRILLLDEPTSSIDLDGQQAILQVLKDLNQQQNLTIVMVSHDLTLLLKYASQVGCVNKTLVAHRAPNLTREMMSVVYHCPIDLLESIISKDLPNHQINPSECVHCTGEAENKAENNRNGANSDA